MSDDAETPSEYDGRETTSAAGVGDADEHGDATGEETEAEEAAAEDAGEADAVDDERTLVARVAAHDEALATEVEALVDEAETLRSERDELAAERDTAVERLQRTQADFQNYKKRAERQREELEERATEDLVERLLDVHDNLRRALDAEGDVRDGVEATLREFDRVLEAEGVEAIDPDPGTEVDPTRHEVLMRVPDDRPEGTIAEVYRPGYEMGGSVVREAQVTVSEGAGDE